MRRANRSILLLLAIFLLLPTVLFAGEAAYELPTPGVV